MKGDLRVNFSIVDDRTEKAILKITAMPSNVFLSNWDVFRRKLE